MKLRGKNCYVIPGDKRQESPWGWEELALEERLGREGGTAYTPVCVK